MILSYYLRQSNLEGDNLIDINSQNVSMRNSSASRSVIVYDCEIELRTFKEEPSDTSYLFTSPVVVLNPSCINEGERNIQIGMLNEQKENP
mmetsp:Transcript_28746/g.27711  ORF Transcript_28746/g.27711 Transcript_28746/m.27711 type:complete len:91 (+) Transcript_28746:316-588(+)